MTAAREDEKVIIYESAPKKIQQDMAIQVEVTKKLEHDKNVGTIEI